MKLDLVVRHIDFYRGADQFRQVMRHNELIMSSGMLKFRINGRSHDVHQPFLALVPNGALLEFTCTRQQERWAAIVEGPILRSSPQSKEMEIFDGAHWIELPEIIPIPPERLSGWWAEWQDLHSSFQFPTPRDLLNVNLRVAHLLGKMLKSTSIPLTHSPAVRLKALIDQDERFHLSLDELSNQCGYSAGHLRALFQEEYGLSPLNYRMRRRMARSMILITHSLLSIKNISEILGFSSPFHFSMVFHKFYGFSPKEAIQKFRSGPLPQYPVSSNEPLE